MKHWLAIVVTVILAVPLGLVIYGWLYSMALAGKLGHLAWFILFCAAAVVLPICAFRWLGL